MGFLNYTLPADGITIVGLSLAAFLIMGLIIADDIFQNP